MLFSNQRAYLHGFTSYVSSTPIQGNLSTSESVFMCSPSRHSQFLSFGWWKMRMSNLWPWRLGLWAWVGASALLTSTQSLSCWVVWCRAALCFLGRFLKLSENILAFISKEHRLKRSMVVIFLELEIHWWLLFLFCKVSSLLAKVLDDCRNSKTRGRQDSKIVMGWFFSHSGAILLPLTYSLLFLQVPFLILVWYQDYALIFFTFIV